LRPVSHLNARYVLDRVRVAAHERRHPDEPWLTAEAVGIVKQFLRPTDRCFEWGSGRSTLWLAKRTASVHSVEHDPVWHERVKQMVAELPTVTLDLVASGRDAYVAPLATAGTVDVILIDGLHRDVCALAAIDVLAPGGLVIIDNVERYLPSSSRAPEAIGDAYATPSWREFAERTHGWRRIWTSNGVSDTAVLVRA